MSKQNFAFTKENYVWLGVGIVLLVIGYLLMSGGGSDNPNEFHADQLFSARRITLAPITVVAGYGTILYAILKKP
ncbi:MAG: hypothetical protein CL847_00350 [Crocinitomicaceae bacterium]|nr:hypothetical protein [Crocinitomicaceae bacterium]|tara:strand:- start:1584 stop:1808 length:225 start_codon:yes stop_codon:yes gene_type:complete